MGQCCNKIRIHTAGPGYFGRFAHDCDLSIESEVEAAIMSGSCHLWRRFWFKLVCVSERRTCVLRVLRSHYAVTKEKHRQITMYPFRVHPYSDFRLLWEMLISIMCIISLIVSPLAYGFYRFPYFEFIGLRITFVVVLLADILVNFCTGFFSETKKEVVFTFKEIFWQYAKTYLFFDIVSSIDVFRKNIYINMFASVAKLFRMFTLGRYTTKMFKVLGVSYATYAIGFIISTVLLVPHFVGCLLLFTYEAFKDDSYPDSKRYDTLTVGEIYADVYYHGNIITVLAGHGNREPASVLEFQIVTFCWYITLGFSIYFRGLILQKNMCRTSSKHKYVQMTLQLKEYMRYKQMPRHLQKRLLSYYEFRFQRRFFLENEILNAVSGQLRQEIALHSCRKLVENVTFFHKLPTNQLVRIVSCLKSEIFLTNDVIIKADAKGHEMYFILTGTVAVYTSNGLEVCHLEDGAHFGEIALLTEDKLRTASVVSVEITELYSLSRNDFIRAIHPYPDLMDEIRRIAAHRVEITNTMTEQRRREVESMKQGG